MIRTGILCLTLILFTSSPLRHYPPKPAELIDSGPKDSTLPDFRTYKNVKRKKKAFIDFLLPVINQQNAMVASVRKRAGYLFAEADKGNLAQKDLNWLKELSNQYTIEFDSTLGPAFKKKVLLRVDIVPPSQVMAQAANESAWGTSRFAREANNLFGEWTYDTSKGLEPKRRKKGEKHLVRVFPDVQSSVKRYIHNLNTRRAYKKFREIRASFRQSGEFPKGIKTVEGVTKYSIRGKDYVNELKAMIKHNNFSKLDTTVTPSTRQL